MYRIKKPLNRRGRRGNQKEHFIFLCGLRAFALRILFFQGHCFYPVHPVHPVKILLFLGHCCPNGFFQKPTLDKSDLFYIFHFRNIQVKLWIPMDLAIGIVTLNAKFIHSSLSLRYLRNAARFAGYKNVWIQEYVINQPLWKIAAEIHKRNPDVIGVSIYIWNRTQSFQLIELLKKQNPAISIVIGGPEGSF